MSHQGACRPPGPPDGQNQQAPLEKPPGEGNSQNRQILSKIEPERGPEMMAKPGNPYQIEGNKNPKGGGASRRPLWVLLFFNEFLIFWYLFSPSLAKNNCK